MEYINDTVLILFFLMYRKRRITMKSQDTNTYKNEDIRDLMQSNSSYVLSELRFLSWMGSGMWETLKLWKEVIWIKGSEPQTWQLETPALDFSHFSLALLKSNAALLKSNA